MANFIPRAEHPNPQFERENWLNLNGEWEFEIDNSVSGRERGLQHAEHLKSKSSSRSVPKAVSPASKTPIF